ncbi:MAG: hypothetical protein PHE68_04750 [Candidatus Peribacteraceae bacterium]|nr:hypothetical protein [Candidatus Peribacteraceae bacterium]MDD5074715.1 hypothetical protein [Candidatus Peribacteraceae bacterium]
MSGTCIECGTPFEISDDDRKFLQDFDVPDPKSCPECRLMRRMIERNARRLYWRKSDASGKRILSQYHADHPFPVYTPEEWWSDTWDGLDYGRDIDPARQFFPQFLALKNVVPHQARFLIQGTIENSDYVNCAGFLKNCYLSFEVDYNEDCYYSNRVYHCKNMVDCSNCYESELCYEGIDCTGCHSLFFSQDCQNCSDSSFLKNCIGCRECVGCINQRQKRYMLLNEQLTKVEFQKRREALHLNSAAGLAAFRRQCADFFLTQPQRYVQAERNERSTGDHLYDSKNAFHCLDCKDLEDCRYCAKVAMGVKSSMDYNSWGDKAERLYQCSACGNNAFNLRFCTTCATNNSDLTYCDSCNTCHDCFGCVGLKKKQYCILNKEYSEGEYKKLRDRLIAHMRTTGEWGEYFPKEVCPFAFNETIAMEYFPISKEDAIKRGYKWRDEVDEPLDVKKVIPAGKLPETVAEVPDNVLHWAIKSERAGRPFKITRQELSFYRTHDIPLPRLHPEERHADRLLRRPPRRLWKRPCSACGREIESTFAPERKERVLCEECYLKEAY